MFLMLRIRSVTSSFARNGRELVEDTVDPDAGDRGAGMDDSRVRRSELPRV